MVYLEFVDAAPVKEVVKKNAKETKKAPVVQEAEVVTSENRNEKRKPPKVSK